VPVSDDQGPAKIWLTLDYEYAGERYYDWTDEPNGPEDIAYVRADEPRYCPVCPELCAEAARLRAENERLEEEIEDERLDARAALEAMGG
jgi:hypothetical protein